MKSFLLSLLLFATFFSQAQTTEKECPNIKGLRNICMMVESRSKHPNPVLHYEYMFLYKIFAAACVDPAVDSEEVMAAKIRKMWLLYVNEPPLICNSVKFDTTNGNIIKFAVASRFDHVIFYLTQWGVFLNRVDEVDKITALDYVSNQLKKHKGTITESTLNKYYKQLRDAGAKHAHEL